MATTYAAMTASVILSFAALLAPAQNLDDKVSQARRIQAQSMLGLDDAAMDSMYRLERGRGAVRQTESGREKGLGQGMIDSMLAGPKSAKSVDSQYMDSLSDSLSDTLSGSRRQKYFPKPPKRFEQRIFKKLDRTIFGTAKGAAGRDYVIGPGDEVTISLWGDKEKEYSLPVNGDGKVFMEGVGLLQLSGLNLNEAQARLKEKLARIYSGISRGTEHVDVSLGQAGPIKVFVLGDVKLPGGFVFSGNTSVLSALYFAEGPSDIGTVRNLLLNRGGKKHPIDLYKYLLQGELPNPSLLRDGDILYSGRAEILVEIEGDVGRPATYELKKGEGLKELLEFSGRPNSTAASHRITLQRIQPDGRVAYFDLAAPRDYLDGKAMLELADGDRVLVEKSTELMKDFITVTGPVKYPGTYSPQGVRSVQDIIVKAGGLREDAFLGRAHVVRFRPDGSSRLYAYSLDSISTSAIVLEPKDNILLYSLQDMYTPDTVEVAGAVFNPGRYEFREGMSAMDLVMQAGGFLPQHQGGKLTVFRSEGRNRKVDQVDITFQGGLAKTSETFTLKPRDLLHVPVDPEWYQKEVVVLDGLFKKPGKYALLYPGEKLASVIDRAGGFKDNAYIDGGRFFRTKDSVGRVGVNIHEAINRNRSKSNIGMVGGDSLFIPEKQHTVKVIGEVGFETSVLLKRGANVQYYIEMAGGFTRRSEKDRVVVQYANGETSKDGYFNRTPDAGSVIYVPQGPEPKPVDVIGGINVILGTASIGIALILSIQALSK